MTDSPNYSFISRVSSKSLFNCSTITLEDSPYPDMEFSNQDVQMQIVKDTVQSSFTQEQKFLSQTQDMNTNRYNTQNDNQSILGLINHQYTQQQDIGTQIQDQQSRIFSQQSVESNIYNKETQEQQHHLNNIQSNMTNQYEQLNQVLKKKFNQENSINIYFDQDKKHTKIINHNDVNQKVQNIQLLKQQSIAISEQELAHYTEKKNIMETQYSLPLVGTNIESRTFPINNQYCQIQNRQGLSTSMDTQISFPWEQENMLQDKTQKSRESLNNIYDSRACQYDEQTQKWIKTEDTQCISQQSSQQILCESYSQSQQSDQSTCSDIEEYFQNCGTQQENKQFNQQDTQQQSIQKQKTWNQDPSHPDETGLAPYGSVSGPSQKNYQTTTLQQIVEEKSDQLNTQVIRLGLESVDQLNQDYLNLERSDICSEQKFDPSLFHKPLSKSNSELLNQEYLNQNNSIQNTLFHSQNLSHSSEDISQISQITEKQEKIAKLATSGFKPKNQIMKDLNKQYVQTINKQYDGINFIVYHASLQNWSIIKKVLENKIIKSNLGILNSKNQQNKNLLFYAVYYKKNNIVRKLLTFSNSLDQINILTSCNNSPFKCSIIDNNLTISQLLHQKGADPNYISKISGLPLLMELISHPDADVMKNFINKFQPNFNIPNNQGLLPLQYFCYFRSNLYSDKCPYRFSIQQILQIDNMYNMLSSQQVMFDYNIQQKSK